MVLGRACKNAAHDEGTHRINGDLVPRCTDRGYDDVSSGRWAVSVTHLVSQYIVPVRWRVSMSRQQTSTTSQQSEWRTYARYRAVCGLRVGSMLDGGQCQ